MKEKRILVYGATGYTGKIVCSRLVELGIKFSVAGRDAIKIQAFAQALKTDFYVFETNDIDGWKNALQNVTCLINVAGPFALTAENAMHACIANKVHYLDISAEMSTYQIAETLNIAAKEAGVMIMSGAGLFVSYDALVMHTIKRINNPEYLSVAFRHFGGFSKGSILSSKHIADLGVLVRSNHKLVQANNHDPKIFDFGDGLTQCLPTSLGGTIISYKSTGIPNINEYFQLKLPALTTNLSDLATLPDGPSKEERDSGRNKLAVEVIDVDGTRAYSIADLPSGYSLTPLSVVAVANRVLNGGFKIGNQTPGAVFGEDIIYDIPGAVISDVT